MTTSSLGQGAQTLQEIPRRHNLGRAISDPPTARRRLRSRRACRRLSPLRILAEVGELDVASTSHDKDDGFGELLPLATGGGGTSVSACSGVEEEIVVRVLQGLGRCGGRIHQSFDETSDGEVLAGGKEVLDARDEVVESNAADSSVADALAELVKCREDGRVDVKGDCFG